MVGYYVSTCIFLYFVALIAFYHELFQFVILTKVVPTKSGESYSLIDNFNNRKRRGGKEKNKEKIISYYLSYLEQKRELH